MIERFRPKTTFTLITLLCLFSFFFLLPSFARANYQTARNDYVYQYTVYRNALSQYQVTKSAYLTYGTLTSQNDAINAFRAAVQARDQVISVYYDLLQEKLNATVGIPPSYLATFNQVKQNEKTWLSDHQTKIEAANSLDDLNAVAGQFEAHYPQFDHETKQAVGMVLLTKEDNLKTDLDANIASLSAKIAEIRQQGMDTSLWDRGLINVKNKLDLYTQKYSAARNDFLPPNSSLTSPIDINRGQSHLSEANQYLRETLTYLLEIIKSITG